MVNIEYIINDKAFRGWFGRWKKQTDNNIEKITEELLEIIPKEKVIKQIQGGIKRINRNQVLYGLGLAINLTVGSYIGWLSIKSGTDYLTGYITTCLCGISGVCGIEIAILDKRRYLYSEVKKYINKTNV